MEAVVRFLLLLFQRYRKATRCLKEKLEKGRAGGSGIYAGGNRRLEVWTRVFGW